jgi:hypothetical protein
MSDPLTEVSQIFRREIVYAEEEGNFQSYGYGWEW